jgi:predicted O-linked N-acetylglucosamine transferase (SPINDLY family)
MRRLEAAARAFGEAIVLAADFPQARSARATVLTELGRLGEAEEDLRKAIEHAPGDAQLHHNLAFVLAAREDRKLALAHYGRALELDPGHGAARENRAALRLASGDGQGALADFDALGSVPGAAAGRVRALLLLHRDEEALAEAERLLKRDPRDPLGSRLKGMALASLGRLSEAEPALSRSAEPASARSVYIDRALERQRVCDWHDRDRLMAAVREALAQPREGELTAHDLLPNMLALPLSRAELSAAAARIAQRVRRDAAGLAIDQLAGDPSSTRMRIGFLSPDFREHPGAHLLRALFAHRDRRRFEYFVYALNPDDGSAIRAELAGSADLFIDVSSWSSADIVRRVRLDRLHLLIDKTGYFEAARPEILAARCAPVQASFKGFMGTLGPGIVDYRISDAMTTPPETQEDWHERLVLLPQLHWAYDTAQTIADAGSREAHGLPERGFVYCSFVQSFRVCPDVFAVWMRLLLRTPGSVLWLLDGGELARGNLAREARAGGVDPSRLVFAPRIGLEAHLGRLRHADLFLDALNYGAHTTAADALHAGLPILTRRGSTMASRLCATLVHYAGLPDLVADGLEDYEQRALELAARPALLADAKSRLRGARASAPFFATGERVRAIERAFTAMIERQRAGREPATLAVD